MNSIATTTKRLEEIIWDKVPGTDESFPSRAAQDILAEFVVIPRADLPEVAQEGICFRVDSLLLTKRPASSARNNGIRFLAFAEYLEAQEHADKCARASRRDELARELTVEDPTVSYDDLIPFGKAAIDRIIAMEEAANA